MTFSDNFKDGRKRAALRRALIHRTDQTVFHHPGVEERPDEFEHTLIGHSRGDARHQAVVIDSVEKLFEIEIDHDVVAVGDVTLRLSHCLMGGAPRSKAVAVLGKRRVPPLLENLQHSLLNRLSTTQGTPSFLIPPSGFGISTRLTGCG